LCKALNGESSTGTVKSRPTITSSCRPGLCSCASRCLCPLFPHSAPVHHCRRNRPTFCCQGLSGSTDCSLIVHLYTTAAAALIAHRGAWVVSPLFLTLLAGVVLRRISDFLGVFADGDRHPDHPRARRRRRRHPRKVHLPGRSLILSFPLSSSAWATPLCLIETELYQ